MPDLTSTTVDRELLELRSDEGDPEDLVQMGSRVWVKRGTRDEFKRRFGSINGAINYILEHAIEEFMELTKDDPELKERVKEAMRNHMAKKFTR